MAVEVSFTVTETKMLAVLADGQPHRRAELHRCLSDNLGEVANIRKHVSNIRKKLRLIGQDIVCVLHDRTICYRHVRLLAPKRRRKH